MRKHNFISPFLWERIPDKETGLEALVELAIEYDFLRSYGVGRNKKLYAVFAKRYSYWFTLRGDDLLLAGCRYNPEYYRWEFLGLLSYDLDNKTLLDYLDLGKGRKTAQEKEKKLLEMDIFKHLFFQRFEVDIMRRFLKVHIDDMVKAFKTKSFLFAYENYDENYAPKLTVRTGLGSNDVMELTPIYCPPAPLDAEDYNETLGITLYPNTGDFEVDRYHFIISDIIHDRFLAYNFANLMYTGNPYVLIDLEAALKNPVLRKAYMYKIGVALLCNIAADIDDLSKKTNASYKKIYELYAFMKFGNRSNKLTKLVEEIMRFFRFHYYNTINQSHVYLFGKEIVDTIDDYYEKSKDITALTNIEPFVVLPGPIEFQIIS